MACALRLNRSAATRRRLVSLTPLIDVVFILLLFFMLASSHVEWRELNLSAPVADNRGTSTAETLFIEIRADDLRIGEQSLPLHELAAVLAERQPALAGQAVYVQPDAGVSLQRTLRVLDILDATAIGSLSLLEVED